MKFQAKILPVTSGLGLFLRSLSSNVRKNNWYRFIISPEWIYKECEAIIHS